MYILIYTYLYTVGFVDEARRALSATEHAGAALLQKHDAQVSVCHMYLERERKSLKSCQLFPLVSDEEGVAVWATGHALAALLQNPGVNSGIELLAAVIFLIKTDRDRKLLAVIILPLIVVIMIAILC